MKIVWTKLSRAQYLSWAGDKLRLKRINRMIEEIKIDPGVGIGRPERLRGSLAGWWSRRISDGDRLVYRVDGDELHIIQCRYHYDD